MSPPRRAAAPGLDSEGRRQRRSGSTAETNISRSLAHRQADQLINEVRCLIERYDAGLIDLEQVAWEIGRLGASLGAKAARGHLRRAS